MFQPAQIFLTALTVLTTVVTVARAQTTPTSPAVAITPRFEILLPTGTTVPTGAQQHDISRGPLTAVQAAVGIRPDLVVTGTLGWARLHPRDLGDDARLHMITYDAGVEYRRARRSDDHAVNFKPFVGAGIGARMSNYRHVDVASTHRLAAYVSAGGELGLARVRLRLEVRNYVTGDAGSTSARTGRRNDVAVMSGVRVAFR